MYHASDAWGGRAVHFCLVCPGAGLARLGGGIGLEISLDWVRDLDPNLGIDDVITMDTGHSPFVTHPEELAAILLAWA